MEKKEIKNAKDAKQLTLENQLTVKEALSWVATACRNGEQYTVFRKASSIETINKLIKLGFQVSIVEDPLFKTQDLKISWADNQLSI